MIACAENKRTVSPRTSQGRPLAPARYAQSPPRPLIRRGMPKAGPSHSSSAVCLKQGTPSRRVRYAQSRPQPLTQRDMPKAGPDHSSSAVCPEPAPTTRPARYVQIPSLPSCPARKVNMLGRQARRLMTPSLRPVTSSQKSSAACPKPASTTRPER